MSTTAGTYSVPVSGPSNALAFLRALILKARGIARAAWHHTRVTAGVRGLHGTPDSGGPDLGASCG